MTILDCREPAMVQAFQSLIDSGRQLLRTSPELRRVICLSTGSRAHICADDWVPSSWTPGDFRAEEAAVQKLAASGDTAVDCIVILWQGETPQPDPPSWYLCQRLLETNPQNLDTRILLWCGGDRYSSKSMRVLVPPHLYARFGKIS